MNSKRWGRNSKERIRLGSDRRNYKLAIAWEWLQVNHPQVAEVIIAEAARKFPLLEVHAAPGATARKALKFVQSMDSEARKAFVASMNAFKENPPEIQKPKPRSAQ